MHRRKREKGREGRREKGKERKEREKGKEGTGRRGSRLVSLYRKTFLCIMKRGPELKRCKYGLEIEKGGQIGVRTRNDH